MEDWLPTFYAESKNPKIPNSHFHRCGEREGIAGQLLMLSPKMLKSKIHIVDRWGGGISGQLLMLSPKMLKS